jgi:hypothetical protein
MQAHPYGDGNGVVRINATADHAITYRYYDNNRENNSSTSGNSFLFTRTGSKISMLLLS